MRGMSSSVTGRFTSLALAFVLALGVNAAPIAAAAAPPDPLTEAASQSSSSEPTVTVVRELTDRRTETSKHYLLSNGAQRAEISGAPVHFKDGHGHWQDIDTSLEAVGPGQYKTRSASITAEFAPDAASGAPVTVGTKDWSVGIDYIGAADKTPLVAGDSARYLDVAPGADLIYETLADGIKEKVVLDSPAAASTFTFKLTTEGVELQRLPIGGYALVSRATGEVESVMGTLEVFDSATPEPARCAGATMAVTSTSDGALVTCEVPRSWLEDPARVFPVTVDPTFTSLFDTYVASGTDYAGASYGSEGQLKIGRWSATSGYHRAYTFFDVSSITTSSEVYSATYSAYIYDAYDLLSRETRLGRLTGPFTETTTWTSKPGYSYLGVQSIGTKSNWIDWNVKSTVQGWISGSIANYGLQMYQLEDGTQDTGFWRRFYSSEYSDGGKRPKLVIDYNSLPANVSDLATRSSNVGLDWWRASDPTAKDDLPNAGRGNVTLNWTRPARAEGYHVWMFDGGTYHQVANIADPRTTTWSTQDAQLYPPDTEISSWGNDSQTNPFAAAASPSHASVVTTATRDVVGPANTGIITTDGTYLYLHSYGGSAPWYRVGNNIESTSVVTPVGPSVTTGRTGFYLDGYLYTGYAVTPTSTVGVWKGSSVDETKTRSLVFSRPFLDRETGDELNSESGDVLLATDGERIYNGASKMLNNRQDGYRIRVYDTNGTWIEDHDVPMVAYTPGTMFTDGESLYFVRWAGTSNDTDVDKISLDSFRPVNRYDITQLTGSLIGATYDRANDCFFGGTLYDDKVYRFKGPGLDLRDNPNALYQKTPGESYENSVNYWFRVTAYNSTGEPSKFDCPAYTPTLPNRSITAVDDPRHTTEDLGDFAGHSMSAVLDKSRLQVEVEDLSLASYGPAAALSRVYRSDDTTTHGFATGWRFSFDQSIESSGTTHKTWIDEAGERHTFTYDAASTVWVAPPGLAATLTPSGSGGVIETADHTLYGFDAFNGALRSVTDRQGDKTSYDYTLADDVTIIAANGRTITVDRDSGKQALSATDGIRSISYNTTGTPSITRFSGTPEAVTVEYEYSGLLLSTITVPDYPAAGDNSAYAFTYASGKLSEVRQPCYAQDATKKTAVAISGATATITRTGEVSGTVQPVMNAYSWNPNGTTATKTDPKISSEASKTWTYSYAPNNELKDTFSPTGAQAHRVVDAAGRLLYDYDEAGHRSAYYYNDLGDCIREVGPRGQTTYRSFDASGNVAREEKVVTADGERAITTWSGFSHGLAASESRRVSTTETYTTEYAYDASGQIATETAMAVRLSGESPSTQDLTTRKVLDASGNVTAEYDAAGLLTTSTTYDAAGRAIASKDASGVVTHHVYDKLGNETETWRSHDSTSTKADWVMKDYDALGRVSSETYLLHDGSTTTTQTVVTHAYDSMGREVSTDDTTVAGMAARSYYDARGNVTKSWTEGVPSYAEARANRTDFDEYGRQKTTYEPGTTNVASTFTYYPDGELKRENRADGSWTEYLYDDGGNKINELTPSDSGTATATFAYDVGGRLISETDADGAVTTHTYDLLGRETRATGEGPASSITYNALGNVISQMDADGVKTDSTFNTAGFVTKEVVTPTGGGATRTTTTAYDQTGRVLTSTDPDGKRIDNDYDVFGRATRERHTTSGPVKDESRTYDSLGRTVTTTDLLAGIDRSFSYPTGVAGSTTLVTKYAGVTTTTTVGTDGRETSRVSDLLGLSLTRSSTASDTAGRETGWSVGNTSYTRSFNDGGQLSAWGAGSGSVSGTLTYDDAARKSRDQMSSPLLSGIDQTYLYTDEGRLSTIKPSGVATTTYTFDPAGNLTTETVGGTTTVTSYDTAVSQRLINRSVGGSVVSTYTFDAFGQRIAQGPTSNPNQTRFTYTGTGRLASYATSAGVSASYSYDAAGQRTRSVVTSGSVTTTTTYTYEGLSLLSLAATQSTGATYSVSYLYDAQARPYAGVYASGAATPTVFQVVTTDRGDVVELLDTAGTAFAAYRYDAWGVPTETTSTAAGTITSAVAAAIASRQPLRYAGYAYDEHSGLYYLSARSYDPVTRQFLSKDPAKDDGEESAYQYCGGDPVGKVDPTGEISAAVALGIAAFALAAAGIYYYSLPYQQRLELGYAIQAAWNKHWAVTNSWVRGWVVYAKWKGHYEKQVNSLLYGAHGALSHLAKAENGNKGRDPRNGKKNWNSVKKEIRAQLSKARTLVEKHAPKATRDKLLKVIRSAEGRLAKL